jgi:hypothetical protein
MSMTFIEREQLLNTLNRIAVALENIEKKLK